MFAPLAALAAAAHACCRCTPARAIPCEHRVRYHYTMSQARGGSRRGAPLLEAVPANGGDCRFSRALGSVDYHTREAGLAALTAWLAARSQLEELDLLKLWKGIFYCFWHSDKSAVQVRQRCGGPAGGCMHGVSRQPSPSTPSPLALDSPRWPSA